MRRRTFLLILLWIGIVSLCLPGTTFLAQPSSPTRAYLPLLVGERPRPRLHPFPTGERYTVQEGDTLFTLARRLHRPLHLLACAIPEPRPATAPLVPGETLLIPPERSLCHVVQEGQTLRVLARAYGVTLTDIVAMPQNRHFSPPYDLEPGRRVLIPLPPGEGAEPWDFGSGHFIRPVSGVISQGYSPRHRGVDIAADRGTVVAAADTGRVAWAGWNDQGYGWLVIVDHRNGYRTYYAHLDAIWVARGERVIRGQPIGVVGTTGHSTGPHLHFEIRDYGFPVDPVGLWEER